MPIPGAKLVNRPATPPRVIAPASAAATQTKSSGSILLPDAARSTHGDAGIARTLPNMLARKPPPATPDMSRHGKPSGQPDAQVKQPSTLPPSLRAFSALSAALDKPADDASAALHQPLKRPANAAPTPLEKTAASAAAAVGAPSDAIGRKAQTPPAASGAGMSAAGAPTKAESVLAPPASGKAPATADKTTTAKAGEAATPPASATGKDTPPSATAPLAPASSAGTPAAPPPGAVAPPPGAGQATAAAGSTRTADAAAPPAAPATPAPASTPASPQAAPQGGGPAAEAAGARAQDDTSLARIANAEASPLQALALAQAALIDSDTQQSEARIAQLAEQRRQTVNSHVAAAQNMLGGFVAAGLASARGFILGKQAQVQSAASDALSGLSAAVTGALQAAQLSAELARLRVQASLGNLSLSLQERVSGIAGRITGFLNGFSLPDLPGAGALRSLATGMLGSAANLVNQALGSALALLGQIANAGFGLLDALLTACSTTLATLLAMAGAAITNSLRILTQALDTAMSAIAGVLNRVVRGLVIPTLGRAGALAIHWIGRAQRTAVQALHDNRRRAHEALADALAPRDTGNAPPADPPPSDAARFDALRQVRQDALHSQQGIVRLFDLLTGGTFSAIVRAIATGVTQTLSAIGRVLGALAGRIEQLARQALQALGQVAQRIGQTLADIGAALSRLLGEQLDAINRLLQNPIDQTLRFAGAAFDRISGFVRTLVGNFIRAVTGSSGGSASQIVGEFNPAASALVSPGVTPHGPITKPLPTLIEFIIRVAAPLVVAGVTALMVFLFGPELAVLIMANPLLAILILLVLAVLLVLFLALLYGLLKLILRIIKPKPPKKPVKRVIRVTPARLELGVGGRNLRTDAILSPGAPRNPPLTWTINPGGTPPTGVSVLGAGRRVQLHSAHPPHATVLGGTHFTVRAALTANPTDSADSAPINLIQVLSANYTANPPLANVPSLIPGTAPVNTGEPNRDGISGNTVTVNATTAPTPRSLQLTLRRALGARVTAMTVKPGSSTGDVGLRIADRATGATLDETRPSTAGPATLMADLTINAVPTKVSGLANAGNLGPYGVLNTITFASSDSLHPPLARVTGELITDGGDQLNVPPPNAGFNNTFQLNLAVPANQWNDQLVTPSGIANATDGRPAIDVNRFVGPGVPQLPRALIYRQRFQYSAWQGAGTVISRTIADGKHIRSLIGAPGAFQFKTEHRFGSVAAAPRIEPYVGNPLIVLSNMTQALAPGATSLAADNASTAAIGITSSVAGRTINWSVRTGDMTFIAGNPSIPPATATLRAGSRVGNFTIRAADSIFPNRQLDGQLRVAKVVLANMRAADPSVPAGSLSTTVSLDAEPGARTVNWSVDAAAAAAGVTVTPASTGPGAPAMTVTVTRPAGFTGRVRVTAADSVIATRTASVRIRFR